jgi:hypothetical protein
VEHRQQDVLSSPTRELERERLLVREQHQASVERISVDIVTTALRNGIEGIQTHCKVTRAVVVLGDGKKIGEMRVL